MRVLRYCVLILTITIALVMLFPHSCAFASGDIQSNAGETTDMKIIDQEKEDQSTLVKDSERNNFDIASLLSLLGVGLLKFIDDKLKIKLKNRRNAYKRYLIIATVVFSMLEIAIAVCYFGKLGVVSFGNLKNLFLGFIPVVFCVLTLSTDQNESNPVILSHDDLETRINEFTSSGMAPLGMLVGDMDFFGKVYNNNNRKGKADDITSNSQIKAILDNNIDRIEIVCKIPTTKDAKRRIGYLLDEFEERFHIRFFATDIPIPQMRGRIMYRQNEQVVVITKKIKKPSKYEYSEYAVSSLPGGLFADLWRTIWGCSTERPDILEQCREAYTTYIDKIEENT